MSMLYDICKKYTKLNDLQIEQLENISAVFELASDIAHAQLTLYLKVYRMSALVVALHAKPSTSYIVHRPLEIGSIISSHEEPLVYKSIISGQSIYGKREWMLGMFMDMLTYPIYDSDSRLIGVLCYEVHNDKALDPQQKILIDTAQIYLASLKNLPSGRLYRRLSPRDGIVIIDDTLKIMQANASANSIFYVLGGGHIVGKKIYDLRLNLKIVHKAVAFARALEAEYNAGTMILSQRAIPIIMNNKMQRVILILSDITEVKQKEKELLIKSAVIQEIHHRVKNNLQTIASLLRLQSRRTQSEEAKAALKESVNRILSISVVHEFLSQQDEEFIDVAEVAKNITNVIINNMLDPAIALNIVFGKETIILPSDVATSIALVINELVQNAIEHAFIGRQSGIINIDIFGKKDYYHINICDDGIGLPPDFNIENTKSLGLQIIRTLIEADLNGSFILKSDNGTQAYIKIPRHKNGG